MSQYRWTRRLVALWALGAFAATGCFVVDDKDSDDNDAGAAGEESGGTGGTRGGASGSSSGGSSKGGSSTGGTDAGGTAGTESGGTAGTDSGGTAGTDSGGTAGAGPSGGSAGTGGGTGAVLKFCNLLFLTDPETMAQTPVELTLDFNGTSTSALSDTCTPVVPDACTPIANVTNPVATLLDGTVEIVSLQFELVVTASSEVIMWADTDELDVVTIVGGTFLPEFPCADTDPLTAMLSARSAPFGGAGFAKTFRLGEARNALRGSVGSRLYLPRK